MRKQTQFVSSKATTTPLPQNAQSNVRRRTNVFKPQWRRLSPQRKRFRYKSERQKEKHFSMDVRALSIVFPCSASSFLSTQGLMFFLTILIGSVLFGSFSTLFNNRKDEKTSNEALSESSIWNWLFWTSESPTALLFANHISSNWIVQPTISQRQWWQWWNDQEENDNCEEDLYDDQIQALKGLVERQFPSIMNKVRFSRNIDCPTMGCFFVRFFYFMPASFL